MAFDLRARLSLDSKPFDSTLKAAEGRASTAFSSIGQKVAGIFTAGLFVNEARKAVEFASKIHDLSEATGLSAERLQEMDFAAQQTGTTLEAMIKAFRKLAAAREAALKDPTGKESQSFAHFGINQETLRGNADPAILFSKLGEAVQKTNIDLNSTPQILDLIGERNQGVITVMKEGFGDLAQQARDFGLVLENDVIDNLEAVGDAADRNAKKITGIFAKSLNFIVDKIEAIGAGLGSIWGNVGEGKTMGAAFAEGVVEHYREQEQETIARAEARAKRRVGGEEIGPAAEVKKKEAVAREIRADAGTLRPIVNDSLAAIGGFTRNAANDPTNLLRESLDVQRRTLDVLREIERAGFI